MPTIAHCYQCKFWEARDHDKTVGRCDEHEGQLAGHDNPPSDYAMVLLPMRAPACTAAEWDEKELAEELEEIMDCEARADDDRRAWLSGRLTAEEAKPRMVA